MKHSNTKDRNKVERQGKRKRNCVLLLASILFLCITVWCAQSFFNLYAFKNLQSVSGQCQEIVYNEAMPRLTTPIELIIDGQEYDLIFQYGGRAYGSKKGLYGALCAEISEGDQIELLVAKELLSNIVLQVEHNGKEYLDFESACATYRTENIIGALFCVFLFVLGLGFASLRSEARIPYALPRRKD